MLLDLHLYLSYDTMHLNQFTKGSHAMCTQEVLNKIAQELKSEALLLFPNVHKIILYGSYARGDNTPESDIDIMIVIDDAQ